jgi:hypothetical protein
LELLVFIIKNTWKKVRAMMEVLIYIPEDKIPKNLGGCSVEISFCGGHVSQTVMVDRYDEEGLDFTELPKGHGKLIDADYLKDVTLLHNFHANNKNIVPYADRKGYRLRQKEVDESIINAPTIIEKDNEGK